MKAMKLFLSLRDYLSGVFGCFCLCHAVLAGEETGAIERIQSIDVDCLFAKWGVTCREEDTWLQWQGVSFRLRDKAGLFAGSVRLGVYVDEAAAERRFREQSFTAVPPYVYPCADFFSGGNIAGVWRTDMLTNSIAMALEADSERERKTGCGECISIWRSWKDRSLDHLCFRRGNAMAELSQMPSDVLFERATQLYEMLGAGTGCVRKGKEVEVPPAWTKEKCQDWVMAGMPCWTAEGYACVGGPRFGEGGVCVASRDCVIAEPMPWKPEWLEIAAQRRNVLSPEQIEERKSRTREAIAILESGSTNVFERGNAALTLGKSGDETVIPLLLEELERAMHPLVRQNCIEALRDLKAHDAISVLIRILETPPEADIDDENGPGSDEFCVRWAAIVALWKLGDRDVIEALKGIAQSPYEYPQIKKQAVGAISSIESRYPE